MSRAPSTDGLPSTTNRFATSITLHAQEKCMAGTKTLRFRKTAKPVDLLWDSERRGSSPDPCWQRASGSYLVGWQVSATWDLNWRSAVRLRKTARDSELMHSQ